MPTMIAASFRGVNSVAVASSSSCRVRHKIRIIVIYGEYIIMLMLALNSHNTPKCIHQSEDESSAENTHYLLPRLVLLRRRQRRGSCQNYYYFMILLSAFIWTSVSALSAKSIKMSSGKSVAALTTKSN